MTLAAVTIDDKFTLERGRVFISGTQALVRAALMQRQRDAAAGLDTAGFISGYRGSPLGGLDLQMSRWRPLLDQAQVTFEPGLNEDLAATAVWGSQQANALPGATHDGVFGLWYGKGPGVDRSGDAIKHGNNAGTSRHGGVLAVFGDDHPGKSSTIAHQSEQAMMAFSIPVLYPATVQEYIDFALLGWAMSRYTGLWIGFKCVNETVENTATVDVDPDRLTIVEPPTDGEDVSIKVRYAPQDDDVIVQRKRMPRVAAFAAANPLDRVTHGKPGAPLTIVTSGKAWLDVCQALESLGIDEARADAIGLAVYKVGLVWPLHAEGLRAAAAGAGELLFIEEKRPVLEPQAAAHLYHLSDAERPRIAGKQAPDGTTLLPSDVQLDTLGVARVIVERLRTLDRVDAELEARSSAFLADGQAVAAVEGAPLVRTPFFCSGCPHNRSTKVPEGSLAASGIGCHGMATLFMSNTIAATQMGAEGANWIGMSRYTSTPHLFQNIGDGTYNHSGLLAIRAAVAARVNITYKILFNDAVAMTGGQPVEGELTVDQVARQVAAEGVRHIAVVTDEPNKYHRGYRFPDGARVHDRKELDAVQRALRDTGGVTAIIYDQTCAAEKRRRRKRGAFPNPARRAFINEHVCEGCGDCSVQANCVSIQPKDTPLGRKRVIDQSSCNKDFSCVEGFCPSFVTVHDAEPKRGASPTSTGRMTFDDLPTPEAPALDEPYNVLINGVGGTGVVTISAVLGMAAHMEGKSASIYDMTGLSQKGGTVFSHLRLGPGDREISGARIGAAQADLLLGCDLVVSAGRESLAACKPGSAHAVVNAALVPTGAFQLNPDIALEVNPLQDRVKATVGHNRTWTVDANGLARTLLGDTIGANMFMVGYALQRGLLPVGIEAVEAAIELNAVAVDLNLSALNLGRLAAHDPAACAELLDQASGAASPADETAPSLDEFIAARQSDLVDYQDSAYATRYRSVVDAVRAAESALPGSPTQLTEAVARYLYKVMAYKDEYEVARLYTDGRFEKALEQAFEPGYRLEFHLAPPWLPGRHPSTGLPAKRAFGPWVLSAFRFLASMKGLRGGWMDLFGMSSERREERRVRDEYEALMTRIARELTPDNHAAAVELAEVPERIRGYGHVKRAHMDRADEAREAALARFTQPQPSASAREVETETA